MDEHVEDDTLYKTDVDSTIVERSIVRYAADEFIDNRDEQLLHQSGISDDES